TPACTHTTADDAENDHIEEFDHTDPTRGGPTSLHNLHRLDWRHHDLKTAGRLDPVREPDGSTPWTVGSPALISTRVAPRGGLAVRRFTRFRRAATAVRAAGRATPAPSAQPVPVVIALFPPPLPPRVAVAARHVAFAGTPADAAGITDPSRPSRTAVARREL